MKLAWASEMWITVELMKLLGILPSAPDLVLTLTFLVLVPFMVINMGHSKRGLNLDALESTLMLWQRMLRAWAKDSGRSTGGCFPRRRASCP